MRQALTDTGGNVTRAAKALGIVRTYATKLVKLWGLREFAEGLRLAAGNQSTGRPKVDAPPPPTKKRRTLAKTASGGTPLEPKKGRKKEVT